MTKGFLRARTIGLAIAACACFAVPAQAAHASVLSSLDSLLPVVGSAGGCTPPALTTPFASWGDQNDYALAPGQTTDHFNGDGWLLLTGARIVTTTTADGSQGSALELPLGAVAVSPPMCVTDAFPTARAMTSGARGGGALMSVLYAYRGLWGNPLSAGVLQSSGSAWAPSPVVDIHPGPATGWQEARFVFVGTGLLNPLKVYDLYVDPRMKD